MDQQQQSEATDWTGWEAVRDVYGRERHRPALDRDGKPFMPTPESDVFDAGVQVLPAAVFRAEDFPPGNRVLPCQEFDAPSRLRFVPIFPWER